MKMSPAPCVRLRKRLSNSFTEFSTNGIDLKASCGLFRPVGSANVQRNSYYASDLSLLILANQEIAFVMIEADALDDSLCP